MIDHISIGVRDLVRAKAFYDAVLTPLGYGSGTVSFWVLAADVPVPANDASGLHICFASPSKKSVDAFHAAALEHGGRDNGVPGLRADYDASYYAAFVVDPDGYRIEAYSGSAR